MMITVASCIEEEVHRKNQQFVMEACRLWDKLEGCMPLFPLFIKSYVQQAWEDYARSN